ncbi:hypothetical protein MMC12_004184 [Toensbergia leucococca]|nr:hypothetical protein [Toensbergia leucococca]
MTSTAHLQPKPILHVEVCTNVVGAGPRLLPEDIATWLRNNYLTVELNQSITEFPGLNITNPSAVDFRIAAIAGIVEPEPIIELADVDINVEVYQLHGYRDHQLPSGDHNQSEESNEDGELSQAKITNLPSRSLHGIWDSLIFNEPLPSKMLQLVVRMMSFSTRQLDYHTVSWNRLILLHGPPGTGKTSLCRALAQKLSIRLRRLYPTSKMVEIDAHSLFSKYFSESGKLVSKMFESIEAMLDEDESTLVVVFIDEIESMTSTREQSVHSNEPRDALRAVNALLIALDRLRHRPNVVILCTTNLIKAMDHAFLDRVDVKQFIPNPCAKARYEIYRTSYLELAQCGIIAQVHHYETNNARISNDGTDSESPDTVIFERHHQNLDEKLLPAYDLMQLHFGCELDSNPRKLWEVAKKSINFSGRTLRRLPVLALAMHTENDPCSFEEALTALSRAVEDEKAVEAELIFSHRSMTD